MMMLLLVQAVAGPVLPRPSRPRPAAPCPPSVETGDVIVCARDSAAYRLKPLPPHAEEPAPPQAAVRIGNTHLSAEGEAAGLPGGIPVNRAMLRLRIPLGGTKKSTAP